MNKEKYIGESALNDKPGKKINLMIRDGSITTSKLADGSVTTEKLADGAVSKEKLDPTIHQEIIDSVTASNEATEKAKEATVKADQATAAATAAKEAADTATQLATTATTASVQATEQAKAATTKAEEATAKANEAAQKADDSREQTEQTLGTMQEVVDKVAIKDEEGTLVETPFRYIQNEEFIFAKVDAENKLLFGIQWDGTPKFGKTSAVEDRLQSQVTLLAERVATIMGDEDTTNVIDTMNELKKFFAEIENTETLTSILANLNSLNTKFGEDIKNLQDTKVDKEEGKSLIEDEVKECFKVIENEEFIKAVVDSDDKVLFGFRRDTGKPYYPLNEMYHVEQNEEFFAVWLDAANHVLLGIRRDGQIIGEIHAVNALKQVISQLQSDVASLQEKVGTIDTNLKELLDVFSLQDNEEFLAVEQDAEGKVLSSTNPDGSHYIRNAKSETIPEEFSHIEDPEGRTEITTDAENKVMSYRDSSGKKHEHDMEVTNLGVSNLNLQGNSVNNIQDALKANGFDVMTPVDWSDKSFVQIPEPRCAYANIIGTFPITKGKITKGIIQFNDMQGNYFEKYIEMDIHGRTSAAFKKKNYTFDFFNDEECSDSAKLRFGDWVSMDSFYFQGWYSDAFRGIDIIGYQLYQEIIKTRGFFKDKPYKKVVYKNAVSSATENTNTEQNLSKNALCTPLGFPVILYHEGKFFGVYTVMLKKNRENFLMDKKDYNAIMLDLDDGSIIKGSKDWSSFEIRNPKTLICADGSKYDGDNPKELIDETSEKYSSDNKDMVNTAKTKKYIIGLADAFTEVNSAISSNKSDEEIKSLIEAHYDVDYLIDYIIFSNVIYNIDGWSGNWQWTTWDGVIWNPNPYDLNATFGLDPYGVFASEAPNSVKSSSIASIILKYYLVDVKNRYKELRDKNIVSVSNMIGLFESWLNRIGCDNYKKEFEVWNTTPSQRASNLNTEYWERVGNSYNYYAFENYSTSKMFKKGDIVYGEGRILFESLIDNNIGNLLSNTSCWKQLSYKDGITYQEGDFAFMSKGLSFKFKCKKECNNEPPLTKLYDEAYGIYGFFDSISRIYKWIDERVEQLDVLWNYNK